MEASPVNGELNPDPHETETEHVLVEQNGSEIADNDEEEFEFPFVGTEANVSADEIFHNGQIKPQYPADFLLNAAEIGDSDSAKKSSGRVSLRMLMIQERHATKSCSDDLERVPLERRIRGFQTAVEGEQLHRRWKLRDLLHRILGDVNRLSRNLHPL